MFRYYLGIAIFCFIFAVTALMLSNNAIAVATIFTGIAAAFVVIAFVTSGPESRW